MDGTIIRKPDAETEDYPGLIVHDGRVTGSITVRKSRLPLWCFIWNALTEGWEATTQAWGIGEHYGYTADECGRFLAHLLDQRGELGRLLCILADVERRDQAHFHRAWWETASQRRRVMKQLRICLAGLEAIEAREDGE